MTFQPATAPSDALFPQDLPAWITATSPKTSEIIAFRSGGAFMALHWLLHQPTDDLPMRLLANRMALTAATATSKLEGRLARQADIRDAYHLTPPGEARGPDGDLLAFWRAAARLQVGRQGDIADQMGPHFAERLGGWLQSGAGRARTHGPLAGGVSVLRLVLEADDRAERMACLLSDVVIARALNWRSPLPISAPRLTKTLLRALAGSGDGDGAEVAAQAQILEGLENTARLARDLTRRARALRSVAPKLRAKGSNAAVELFLAEDTVAPASMLSPWVRGSRVRMSARAARRFCDRLVELGVAQELTGRSTFRLYGIAP